MQNMKSPFKFLDSYTKDDRDIFFGRDREIEELYQRVFESKLLLVYGASGTGKSSLIHCGLANKFRETDWLPLVIRRGGNLLSSMATVIESVSLTKQTDLIITDVQFKKAVRSLYLDYYKPLFFIFDQFEELFIFGTKEEDESFIKILKSLLSSDLQCKFIFILREEYLGWLSTFEKSISGFFDNRIRIEKMDIGHAKNAIEGPCKVNDIAIEEGFAENMLKNLCPPKESEVELTYLQVYLDKIFKLASESNKDESNNIKFRLSDLDKAGNVYDILGSFLDEQISHMPDPELAMTVLKAFVSARGTKRSANAEEIKEYALTTGKKIDEKTINDLLLSFVNLRILQDKDHTGRNELKHDALAAKIFEKVTLVEKELIDIKQFIESAHDNWEKRNVLLSDKDLSYIAPYEDKLYLNDGLKSFIAKSKREYLRVKHRRRNIFIASGISLLIIFAIFTIWALLERNKSQKMEIIANANYFSASSKEMTSQNPTKALRLANHAYELNPDHANYQNLVTIYSNNEFYYPIFNDKKYKYYEYKIIANNALALIYQKSYYDFENFCIELYSTDERLINKWDINQEVYYWDVSSDQKSVVTVGTDSILNIYDQHGNLTIHKKLEIKEELEPIKLEFLPDSRDVIIFLISNSQTSGEVYLFSDNDKTINNIHVDFERDTYLADYYFDDKFMYLFYGNGALNKISYDGRNKTMTKVDLAPQEFVNSAELLGREKVVLSTSEKRLFICNWKGNIIKSFTSLTDKINLIKKIDYKNSFLTFDNTGIQIRDYAGNNLKSLRINGIYDAECDYDSVHNRLIFMYDGGKLFAWDINHTDDNLIFQSKEGHRSYPSHQYIVDIIKDTINIYSLDGSEGKTFHIPYNNSGWDIFPSFNFILIHNINNPDSLALIADRESNIITNLKGLDYRNFTTAISNNDSIILSTFGPQRLYFGLWTILGKQKKTFVGHDAFIRRLKISDDNKKIVSGDGAGNIILWDTTGKKLKNFKGHSSFVTSLDISPDGSLILSGSYDGTAKLWNTNGQLLYTFQSPEKYVQIFARFSHGNNSFYITDSKNLRFFNRQGVLLQTFENSSNADNVTISDDNRSIYFPDKSGVRNIRLKEPLDTFLASDRFADLTIAEKLDHGYIQYEDLLRSNDPEQLLSGARYYREKSMTVIESKGKTDFLNRAESLYRTLCKSDTAGIRYLINLTSLLFEDAGSTGKNVKPEIDNIYEILLAQKNYENLFAAGRYFQSNTNSSTIEFDYPNKAITIFNKIISLFPEKKKKLDSQVGSLAWQLVYLKQFKDALDACLLAKRINSEGFYANINLPPCYLLVDSVEKAKRLYVELKDKPVPLSEVQNNEKTFGDVFKSDLNDLKYRGFQIKEYENILKLLGSDSTNLN